MNSFEAQYPVWTYIQLVFNNISHLEFATEIDISILFFQCLVFMLRPVYMLAL